MGDSIIVPTQLSGDESAGNVRHHEQAETAEGIELELQRIPFDKLAYWLAVLQQQHGVAVAKLDMQRHAADSALLDGTLTLNAINRKPEYP